MAPMTTVDVGRPRNGKRPLEFCAATHAQLHDSRLDRTLCHARCTDFRSITCDVAYGSRLGRQEHEQVDVEVSAPKGSRRLRVRIVTQLRSRLGLTRALRVELTISDYVGHKQAEPGPSYDHMSAGSDTAATFHSFDFRFQNLSHAPVTIPSLLTTYTLIDEHI